MGKFLKYLRYPSVYAMLSTLIVHVVFMLVDWYMGRGLFDVFNDMGQFWFISVVAFGLFYFFRSNDKEKEELADRIKELEEKLEKS